MRHVPPSKKNLGIQVLEGRRVVRFMQERLDELLCLQNFSRFHECSRPVKAHGFGEQEVGLQRKKEQTKENDHSDEATERNGTTKGWK